MVSAGANLALTAAVVVATGLVGANFVQSTLNILRLRDPIARGMAAASRYILQFIDHSVEQETFIYATSMTSISEWSLTLFLNVQSVKFS